MIDFLVMVGMVIFALVIALICGRNKEEFTEEPIVVKEQAQPPLSPPIQNNEVLKAEEKNPITLDQDIGHLNADKMAQVINYFSKTLEGTASEIGVSGSFMSSLVRRGYIKIVRKQEGPTIYVSRTKKIDTTINVYALNVSIKDLIHYYAYDSKKYRQEKQDIVNHHLYQAQLRRIEIEEHFNEIFA